MTYLFRSNFLMEFFFFYSDDKLALTEKKLKSMKKRFALFSISLPKKQFILIKLSLVIYIYIYTKLS